MADHYFSWMSRSEAQEVSPRITQVYLELSTHCTLSCAACVRHAIEDFTPRHLSARQVRRILPMLASLPGLERIVLLGFGEAMCNPEFKTILKLLRTRGAKIVLVSNAFYLDREAAEFLAALPLDELWLSWDDEPGGVQRLRKGIDSSRFREHLDQILSIIRERGLVKPLVGISIVAQRSNSASIPAILETYGSGGVRNFILSNVYPYDEGIGDSILYVVSGRPPVDLARLAGKAGRGYNLRIAGQVADVPRRCPFVERGTVFITAAGEIAPCPELAYTHPAWYFGSRRIHRRFIPGTLSRDTIASIWETRGFAVFRRGFSAWEFPDCTTCREPDRCWHRTVDTKDCYGNETPCGECLWAKGIVICP